MVTDTDSYAFFITDLTPTRGRPRLNHIMNRLMRYGVSAVALICMLLTSACSDDSIGTIDYSKVTTGRMDLSNSVAIGLKLTDDEDKNLKPGLYKIDDNGNITTAELLVTVDGDDNNRQEPLRVAPRAIFTASDSYFIATYCQYFDKNDEIAEVPYKTLLVRKSDGKIWGIDDLYLPNPDGVFISSGKFMSENGTLYLCCSNEHNNYTREGNLIKFVLDSDIPSLEPIANEILVDSFHIDKDGVVFSYNNDSWYSGLQVNWPNGEKKGLYTGFWVFNDDYFDERNNNNVGIVDIPDDILVDLIPENNMSYFQYTDFKLHLAAYISISSINNRPVGFTRCSSEYANIYATATNGYIDPVKVYLDETDFSDYQEALSRVFSYALSQKQIPVGYFDITYKKTPERLRFGKFHDMQIDNITFFSNKCVVLEGNNYSVVVDEGHYVSKIDHISGTSQFLKRTETEFGYSKRSEDKDYNPCFLYSDKLWTYHDHDKFVTWFDLNSLEEGRIDFNVDIPAYMQEEAWEFENGNLIFYGHNTESRQYEQLYINILTGNDRIQEIAPGMNFKSMISFN